MEIGPITAVRPIPSIKRSPAAPDLSRVFEVEYLGESADDAYTPGHSNASRGLEDEEDDLAENAPDGETQPEPAIPSIKVNFFA
jgi:hypothetical protein